MRNILENYVREILLQEQVFGAQAFVYHGSKAPPEVLIKAFADGTFDPGQGSGAMYGKGVYTVYEEDPKLATFSGAYGEYVYKLKINLYGYVIFDPEICKKVYGENMSPLEQMEMLGLEEAVKYLKNWGSEHQARIAKGNVGVSKGGFFGVIKKLLGFSRTYEFTSDLALAMSDILSPFVKGLVYTGRRDGPVALAYDPATVVPVAWSYANGKKPEWNKVDIQTLKPSLSRSASGEFVPGKHNKTLVDTIIKEPNTVHEGSLNYGEAQIDFLLPPGLTVKGDLIIYKSKITRLPEGLTVEGKIRASHTLIESIPESTKAHSMDFSDSKLKFLPPNLKVEDLEIERSQVRTLPSGLEVRGVLNINGTAIKELPPDIIVGSALKAEYCSLESIPEGARIRRISVQGSKKIKYLPDTGASSIDIALSGVKQLPPNLNLYSLRIDANFTNLPPGLKLQVLYAPKETKIRSFPPGFEAESIYPRSLEQLYISQKNK